MTAPYGAIGLFFFAVSHPFQHRDLAVSHDNKTSMAAKATPMDSFCASYAPADIQPPELSLFRPLPYFAGQQHLCTNCLSTFESDVRALSLVSSH